MTASAAPGAQQLLPLDLVCLDILRRFFHSCRKGRGGQLVDGDPWIRVTADDMVAYLERDGLDVGFKQVQRSLKRLGDLGLVRRAQRFLHRYDRRMWFAPVTTTFTTSPDPSARSKETSRKDTGDLSSNSFSSNTDSSKVLEAGAPPQQPAERDVVRELNPTAPTASASPIDRGGKAPQAHQKHQVVTEGALTALGVGTPTHPTPKPLVTPEKPQGDRLSQSTAQPPAPALRTASPGRLNLTGILARCLQMGGYSSMDEWEPPAPVTPKAIIRRDGTRLTVADGATSPLR